MKDFYKMGRVVVVTFDENEEEKLNELLHFLSAKKYSEMPGKQNRVLDYGALKINAEYRSVESNGELVQLTNYEFEILYLQRNKYIHRCGKNHIMGQKIMLWA